MKYLISILFLVCLFSCQKRIVQQSSVVPMTTERFAFKDSIRYKDTTIVSRDVIREYHFDNEKHILTVSSKPLQDTIFIPVRNEILQEKKESIFTLQNLFLAMGFIAVLFALKR